MSSRSSPGADTVTPMPVAESNAPSVAKYDAVWPMPGARAGASRRRCAGYGDDLGHVAGTCPLTSSVLSFPAATTTVMPAWARTCGQARSAGLSSRVPGRPRLMLTTRIAGTRVALSAIQSRPAMMVDKAAAATVQDLDRVERRPRGHADDVDLIVCSGDDAGHACHGLVVLARRVRGEARGCNCEIAVLEIDPGVHNRHADAAARVATPPRLRPRASRQREPPAPPLPRRRPLACPVPRPRGRVPRKARGDAAPGACGHGHRPADAGTLRKWRVARPPDWRSTRSRSAGVTPFLKRMMTFDGS